MKKLFPILLLVLIIASACKKESTFEFGYLPGQWEKVYSDTADSHLTWFFNADGSYTVDARAPFPVWEGAYINSEEEGNHVRIADSLFMYSTLNRNSYSYDTTWVEYPPIYRRMEILELTANKLVTEMTLGNSVVVTTFNKVN